jgi:hypothetical protein
MDFLAKTSRLRLPAWAQYAAVFALSALAYGYLQWQPAFRDPDSFYHARMASLMLEQGIIRDFIWLPYTTLAIDFANHHFLYHVSLLPFIAALGPLVGIKVATTVYAAAAITVFYGLLRAYGVRYAAAYAFLLATSSSFLFRLNLAKASAAALILVFLALIAVRKDKPWALFVVAWVYVWTHGGWPTLAIMIAVLLAARAVGDRLMDANESLFSLAYWRRMFSRPRGLWRRIASIPEARYAAAVAGGLVCGLVINPYFPRNLRFYWEQIVQIAVIGQRNKIGVGVEWYPYELGPLVAESGALFVAFGLAIALMVAMILWPDLVRRNEQKTTRADAAALFGAVFLAAAFFLMTVRSRRHIEYFAPLFVLATALFGDLLLARLDRKAFVERIRWLFPKPSWLPAAFAVYWIGLFLFLGGRDIYLNRKTFDNGIPWTKYTGVADWMKKNARTGDVLYHSDWDDFPILFFHDPGRRYIVGLDPTFLYRASASLHQDYVDVTTGARTEGLREAILSTFGAKYAMVENDHEKMLENLKNDPDFVLVYKDEDAHVFAAL